MNVAQIDKAIDILKSGKCTLDRNSDNDYIVAAGVVFDLGLMFCREPAIKMLEEARNNKMNEGNKNG